MRKQKRKQIGILIPRRPGTLRPNYYIAGTGSAEVVSLPQDDLPPYNEYFPNRIHVARRRVAWKKHKRFPRGWTIEYEQGDLYIDTSILAEGSTVTVFKESDTDWSIYGDTITLDSLYSYCKEIWANE